MNHTQKLTASWLSNSVLERDALLLESLLRRGFLAFRDAEGVWIATGSHEDDIAILLLVSGIATRVVKHHPYRVASINFRSQLRADQIRTAAEIIGIQENHGMGRTTFTAVGIGAWMSSDWKKYSAMEWGAKLAVHPVGGDGYGSLDTGVALLIKTLPLVRVGTASSCDGHGVDPAVVDFFYPWDAQWCRAVFETLRFDSEYSQWVWSDKQLAINFRGKSSCENVIGMLNDIQSNTRRLMNHDVIDKVGRARVQTLASFGLLAPTTTEFYEVACSQLAWELSPYFIGASL